MREDSEQVLRERIEASRTRMAETVEEIGVRVNPDRVQREIKARARDEVDQFKATAKQKVRSTMRDLEHEVEGRSRSMWQTVKDNPIPATLVGVGVAWMMANGRSDSESRRRMGTYGISGSYPGTYPPAYPYDYAPEGRYGRESGYAAGTAGTRVASVRYEAEWEDEESDVRERAEEIGEEVRERGAEAADRVQAKAEHARDEVRDRADQAMDTTREKASELADRGREQAYEVRDRARGWADQVEHRARRAERRVEHAVQDNPLAAGAMAAALGFAAGLMVPETQREHEMMGRTRDRMLDRAQDEARGAAMKARDKAKDTAGKAARRAVDEALPGEGGEDERAMTEPGR